MTPAEFLAARNTLGMSAIQLADWLGVSRKSTTRWASGSPIPGPVARALRLACGVRGVESFDEFFDGVDMVPLSVRAVLAADLEQLLATESGE